MQDGFLLQLEEGPQRLIRLHVEGEGRGQLSERTDSPDALRREHQEALPKNKGGGEIERFSGGWSCKVEATACSTVTMTRSTLTGRCLQSS